MAKQENEVFELEVNVKRGLTAVATFEQLLKAYLDIHMAKGADEVAAAFKSNTAIGYKWLSLFLMGECNPLQKIDEVDDPSATINTLLEGVASAPSQYAAAVVRMFKDTNMAQMAADIFGDRK